MCEGEAMQWISRTQRCGAPHSSPVRQSMLKKAEGFEEALFLWYVWRFILPDFGDPCTQIFEDNKRSDSYGG